MWIGTRGDSEIILKRILITVNHKVDSRVDRSIDQVPVGVQSDRRRRVASNHAHPNG
ncbi:MAG: hypothetical protein WBE37_14685 [Bryobacteraceae bacterium]